MANNAKKTAAIVVTCNRIELLKKCISALLGQTGRQFDILVIDNASNDGTGEYIADQARQVDRIRYFNTGSNLGGAGGFSFGVKQGVIMDYDYLWLMDDDTIPNPDALEKLLQQADRLEDRFGFLSSYAVWTDGSPCIMNIPRINPKWARQMDNIFENRVMPLESASFVSLLVRADVVRDVGLPIKEFFIWADDVEYTWRISEKYPCYLIYDSRVLHEMKENVRASILQESGDRLDRYRYLYRNRCYTVRQHQRLERLLYAIKVRNTVRDLLRSDIPDKHRRAGIVLSSYLSGWFFHPSIEYADEE